MKKIDKAWVRTNTRADGKKYYTAYIRLKGYIFYIIPIYFCYPVVREIFKDKQGNQTHTYYLGNEAESPCSFSKKDEAELQLLEMIDMYLDRVREHEDKKIVRIEDNPVSFGSIDH